MTILFVAVHESLVGTKLPTQNVRSPVANGGKADNICSLRDLPVLMWWTAPAPGIEVP